jgi:D-lactate dehydrogenase
MLNPGVMINANPQTHVTHLKTMSLVSPEVDKCIECGFCESKCPSRRLTLTPRQRIVVQREISRLRFVQAAVPGGEDAALSKVLMDDFIYAGIDTCAVDGLCATACPVSINTGDLTRRLRAESITPRGERIANWLAKHFKFTEAAVGFAVRMGHLSESVIGTNGIKSVIQTAEKISGTKLPKWNNHIPSPTKNLSPLSELRGQKDFVYFPSCISRQLGTAKQDSRISKTEYRSLIEALIIISQRANINLYLPKDLSGICCGMPFHSKGYTKAYQLSLHKAITDFWAWSEEGKYPIVIDTTSCLQTLRTCGDDLDPDDREKWKKLILLDSIEFLHDYVLPKLDIQPVPEEVILHPNCSARKLDLDGRMVGIAKQCAKNATVPLNLGCCGFAGDRGLLFPELTASATQKESAEVNERQYGGYYSSNIPCEIGMSEATGKDYTSIVYLVERASRK